MDLLLLIASVLVLLAAAVMLYLLKLKRYVRGCIYRSSFYSGCLMWLYVIMWPMAWARLLSRQ